MHQIQSFAWGRGWGCLLQKHTIPATTPQAIIFHLWLNQENCQHQHPANQGRGYEVKAGKKAGCFEVQRSHLLILLAAWKKLSLSGHRKAQLYEK